MALLVIAGYAAAAPVASAPRAELLEAISSWLPIGGGALRARLSFGAVAVVAAWAVTRALALGPGGGEIAGCFAACLLVGSPVWLGAGPGPALATGAALVALAAARRLAAHGALHDAVAAALAVAVAAAFEPGYAGLALPLLALWWLRIGRRSSLVRSARSPVGQPHLASALVAPGLALAALGAAALAGPRGEPLFWASGQPGGAPLDATSLAGVARAIAELLGPTAAVAALAGGVALLVPPRRASAEEQSGGRTGAPAPGEAEPPAGGWMLAMLIALALGGALCDLRRHALGVPVVTAAALAIGCALQRLAAMAVIAVPAGGVAIGVLAGGESARFAAPAPELLPAGGGEVPGAPAMTLVSGAIFVALTAGFLVVAPSLLS